jgi:hypothetical protein
MVLVAKLRERLAALSPSGSVRDLRATLEAIRMLEAEIAGNPLPPAAE